MAEIQKASIVRKYATTGDGILSAIMILEEMIDKKTTLAKLLLRLYNPTSGSILINGRSISDYRLYDLRLKTGTAFQKTCVYTMSFIKNLSLYKELSESEAEMVSKSLMYAL